MSDEIDQPLEVILEKIEGHEERTTREIEDWYIDQQYLVSTDEFEFTLFETDEGVPAGLDLRPVVLMLDGQQPLLGRIEITSIGSRGSAVTCRGRDFMADLVECNVDPLFKLRDDMTLEQMLLDVCGPCGINKIVDDADDYDADKSIRDIRTGLVPDQKGRKRRQRRSDQLKDYQPKPGEGIYEYINRICARMGLTLQPGPDRRTLFITAPHYEQSSVYEPIRRYRDAALNTGNNCLSATAVRDFTRLPTYTLLTGTSASAGKKGEPTFQAYDMYTFAGLASPETGDIVGRTCETDRVKPGPAPAERATRLYRLLYFRDEHARTQEQLDAAAQRAVAERLKDTLRYTCTVRGHKDPVTDAMWTVDTIVQVEDELCGVNEPLWIAKRTLRFDRDNGATTQLECWRPGSFPFIEG